MHRELALVAVARVLAMPTKRGRVLIVKERQHKAMLT